MKFFAGKNRIVAVGLIVLAIGMINLFQAQVKGFFYFISAPLQTTLWQSGRRLSDFFDTVSQIETIKRESEALRGQNIDLFAEVAELKSLREENELLRRALDIGLEKEFLLTFADITSKDISGDYLLINKGLRDGIAKNMPVVTEKKVLIGKISEVYGGFSRIMLISDKNSSFDAKILEKNVTALVRGEGNSKAVLDLVPADKDIAADDIIITSELGGIFPKGILVGKVGNIRKSSSESFLMAEIVSFSEIKEIEKVFVILGKR